MTFYRSILLQSYSSIFILFAYLVLVVISTNTLEKLYTALVMLIVFAGCVPDTEQVCNKDQILSSKLISVDDAHALLSDSMLDVTLIDIGKEKDYQKGHIAGAHQIWRPDFRAAEGYDYGGMMCSAEELENLLSSLGVSNDTKMLLYDRKGACDALRFAWVLDQYGINHYQVINGGLALWKEMGYAIDTTATHSPTPSNYRISSEGKSTNASMEDIQRAINDPNTLIVDTREPYEYAGAPFISDGKVWPYKKGAHERGHIPTAIHLNWSDLSDLSGDHRIKCEKDLRYDLAQKGITPERDIIVYCQSGSRSSHTAFVLSEILGYPNVKNYDGSWIEWSYYHKKGLVDIEQIMDEAIFNNQMDSLSATIR